MMRLFRTAVLGVPSRAPGVLSCAPGVLSCAAALALLVACGSSVNDGGTGGTDTVDAADATRDVVPGVPCQTEAACDGAFADLGPCEIARCDPATDRCVRRTAPDKTACDDGDPCTATSECREGACEAGDPVDCDDGDDCTADACGEDGACVHEPLDGTTCDDGDPCTTGGTCAAGVCEAEPRDCDDGDPCTADDCDAEEGCVATPLDEGPCEDGDACTTGDTCVAGVCESGGPADCDDGDACTDDACDPVEGCQNPWRDDDPLCSCVSDADCDDGDDCTTDTCDGDGRCVYATVADDEPCDDGDACTEEGRCDGGTCVGQPVDCDDGSLCTLDTCDPVDGCAHEAIPDCACASDGDCPGGRCTVGVCDPATRTCTTAPAPAGEVCDDDDPCTVDTACDGEGACTGGAVVDCTDEFDCTTDFCRPGTGCVHDTSGCECDPAVSDSCDDDNPCTDEACVAYACDRTPVADGTACPDDGDPCTTGHTCQGGVCAFAAYECPEDECTDGIDEDGDGDTDCDDDDCDVSPDCVEQDCVDGIDSDDDGDTDCDDTDCRDALNCNPEAACLDGVDNDIDGLTDCEDPNCDTAPNCNPETNCRNNVDDDFDGARDCDDSDCEDDPSCNPEMNCLNALDDDFDGDTDCDDTDCATALNCNAEPDCANGLDDDIDGATDCDDDDCDEDPACTELACLDGLDSDADGDTDCDDADCAGTFECATCAPLDTIACGGAYTGTTVGGSLLAGVYPACTKEGTAYTGPEAALVFTPPVSGQATVELEAAFDAAIVVLERACRPATSCAAAVNVAHGNEEARVEVVGGTSYYLVVEGVDPNDDGPFTVSVTCPQLLEDCDNGEDDDDDGLVDCDDPSCATNPACVELVCDDETDNDGDGAVDCDDTDCAATFLCSGCAARQTLSCGSLIEDSTDGALNQLSRYPTCTSSSFSGPEHVFAFVPPYDMEATIEVTPASHDAAILVLEGECDPTDSCIARMDGGFFGDPETLTVDLEGGVVYYVVIDSFAPFSFGAYTLGVTCSAPPELCDNGIDDDGNGVGDCLDEFCEGQGCDDANACTVGDVCSLGECLAPFTLDCSDGNDCTVDECEPDVGCVHTPAFVGTPCAEPVEGFCGADGVCKQTAPPGSIIVTEIMKNPSCVSDDVGEWFEVYNTTDEALDLGGWIIRSTNESDHTIAGSLVVAPFGYALFCREGDPSLNGGLRNCAYDYGGGIALGNNGDDAIRLVDPGGTEIDAVAWDDGVTFPDPTGASMSLDPAVLDGAINDFGAQWCEATSGYGSCLETRDRGTPGRVNPLCEGDVCEAATVIGCGDTLSGDTTGVPDILEAYPCTGRAQTGGEQVFRFESPERVRVDATLTPAAGVDLDLVLLRDNCAPADCAGFGDATVDFAANAFTGYYLVVDGFAGARGAFDLTVTCSDVSVENCGNQIDDDEDGLVDCDDLDCDEDPFCTEFCAPGDVPLTCDRVVGGTTIGQPNDITTYSCTGSLTRGGETAYPFTPTETTLVTFTLSYEAAPFLDLYVLDNTCGDTVCVAEGDVEVTLSAQAGRTYYVVVDGRAGTVGDYALATDCEGGVAVETLCDDNLDNDGDQVADCRDADCRFHPFCHERACDDGADDDDDDLVDCDDPDCALSRACFACVDAVPLTCGAPRSGDTTAREDRLHGYDCSDWDESGGEVVYSFVPDGNGPVTARLTNIAGGDLDVFALGQACEPDGCRAFGDEDATVDVAVGQTVYFVVDGFEGATGTFDIELDCDLTPPELCTGGGDEDGDGDIDCADEDCDGQEGCAELLCSDGVDDEGDGLTDCDDPDCDTVRACNACAESVEVFCGDLVFGTTVGAADAIARYGCADWVESGGEVVYRYRTAETTDVVVDLGAFEVDLDVFVLGSACDGASCLARGVQGAFFTALPGRDYYIVVDGFEGAAGAYQLALGCAGIAETCGDDRDNDGDGATDCADSDCYGNPSCPEICDDDIDNDGDGRRDCEDADCDLSPSCAEFCETDQVVACGQTVTGTTVGEESEIFNWQGCAVITATGGEAAHELVVSGPRMVTARLTSDVSLVLFATTEVCADRRCIAFGGSANEVTFMAEPGTNYYVVVDGFLGSAGAYELEVSCVATAEDDCDDGLDDDTDGDTDCDDADCADDPACVVLIEDCANGVDDDGDDAVDCADADCAEVLDCVEACAATVVAECDRLYPGGTVGAANTISYHPTCVDRDETGGEFVYQLTVDAETEVVATLENVAGGDLDLFLLADACDTASCVAYDDAAVTATLEAGRTYYLVVDGFEGAEGVFDLKIDCGGDDTGCFTPDDCVRPECEGAPVCPTEAVCDDAVDDDGDGDTDCDDPDCAADALCQPGVENCADGVDGDGDGAADCFDLDDCLFHPLCDLACPAPAGTVACDAAVTGDTADGENVVAVYGVCDAETTWAGPELVYEFTPDVNAVITATIDPDEAAAVGLLLTEDPCGPLGCLARDADGALSHEVQAGSTYYLVVESTGPAETASFTLRVQCDGDAEVFCDDGRDNDGDGDTDCDDAECGAFPACFEGDCTNGVDDDGDGATDCDDDDCAADAACAETACADGVDDDTDGATDCDDADCFADPACDCAADAAPFACDELLLGSLATGTTRYGAYPCGEGIDASGPEVVYTITPAADVTMVFTDVSSAPDSVDVYVLEGDCELSACVMGPSATQVSMTGGTTYYVVVEGRDGFAGDYVVVTLCP